MRCTQLEQKLNEMRTELIKSNVEVDHDLSNDVSSILQAAADNEVTPFKKLFWKQQKKLLSSSCSGIQYHPMITRFYLSIHAKSPFFPVNVG